MHFRSKFGNTDFKWWWLIARKNSHAQNRVNFYFKSLIWPWRSRSIVPENNRALNQGLLHLWSKFGDPSLNGWWIIARTSSWLTDTYTHTHTQATTIPEGQNWPRVKTIRHLSHAVSSFVHHFIAIGEFKLELQSETPNSGQNWQFFELCDLEIWRKTLKNNRAPLLSNTKLCASFHHYMWIQTGVKVRKWLSGVMTSVTLTLTSNPWPFAWTSLLSMVITPENFRVIGWQEHCQKGVTDRWTDRKKCS